LYFRLLPLYCAIFNSVGCWQAGFVPGKSCRDQVSALKMIMSAINAERQPGFILFLDLKGAYDSMMFLEVPAIARQHENDTDQIAENNKGKNDNDEFKPDQKSFYKEKEQFQFMPTNEKQVQNVINKLETNKAFGHDGIPSKIIKAAKSLTPYITDLINDSLKTGIVPENMKIAKVTPIPKPRTKQEYRPF
jgi:hypothetical protein